MIVRISAHNNVENRTCSNVGKRTGWNSIRNSLVMVRDLWNVAVRASVRTDHVYVLVAEWHSLLQSVNYG